jgi:hypothetical protein
MSTPTKRSIEMRFLFRFAHGFDEVHKFIGRFGHEFPVAIAPVEAEGVGVEGLVF